MLSAEPAPVPRFARLRSALPRGQTLPVAEWHRRHRALLFLLVLSSVTLTLFGVARGYGLTHIVAHGVPPAVFALLAYRLSDRRRLATGMVSIGLMAASSLLVHTWHGAIEAHFAFFVIIVALTLYEDWIPFLMAIGYVVVHHGLVGTLDPAAVYNHSDAIAHPWKWAGIHALFVAAAGALSVVAWRLNEDLRAHASLATDQLEAHARQLNDAQRVAHIGSWEFDIGADEVTWSDELCRIFGRPPGEFPRTYDGYLDQVHPDDRDLVDKAIQASYADLHPYSFDHQVVRPDGSIRIVQARGQVVADESGQPVRMFGTAQDVTERKRVEEQLHAARDEALAGSRAKSEFLANMSHEIRTPLNGVIGMTDLLLASNLSEEQRESAEMARASGEALLAIVNNVLDLSKIEAGRFELETGDFNLRDAAEEVCDLVADPAHEKGLELVCQVSEELPRIVRGDELRLRQVLLNLVANAVKFTAAGEVVVTVEPLGGDTVRFQVTDTGIGIAPSQLERMFEPFSQGDSSTTRRYGGTGLGLTISHQLVQLMGGAMDVDSTPGSGSSFRFAVPLAAAAGHPDSARDLDGLRVLVVDDNPVAGDVISQQLRAAGAAVFIAGSGQDALADLRSARPYDCGLIDVELSDMSGIELVKAIRADEGLRDLPVVMLTRSSGERRAAFKAGEYVHLRKPVRRSRLTEAIRAALGGAPAGAAETDLDQVGRETVDEGPRPLILLAEDNAVNSALGVRLLARYGYDAHVAWDGREAVEACSRSSYAAVLMDCQMPVMDGYEATAEIRKLDTAAGTPIIAMTAHSMKGDRERCLAAGMDDYLSKPIRPDELADALERWVDASRLTDPAAARARPSERAAGSPPDPTRRSAGRTAPPR